MGAWVRGRTARQALFLNQAHYPHLPKTLHDSKRFLQQSTDLSYDFGNGPRMKNF